MNPGTVCHIDIYNVLHRGKCLWERHFPFLFVKILQIFPNVVYLSKKMGLNLRIVVETNEKRPAQTIIKDTLRNSE